MDPLIGVAGGVLTLIGVVVSAVLTKRGSDRKLKQDAGQQMIDQLQEELREARAERAEERAKRADERAKDAARMDAVERTLRIQGDYIGQLRRHIADGNPPPPPAWPDGLIT